MNIIFNEILKHVLFARRLLEGEEALREARKARYLRVDEADIDMSNLNTLVVNQMQQLQSIRIWNQN